MTRPPVETRTWDVVIVGGGSAGSVLAGRLSENARRTVLLIEAGRYIPPGAEPAAFLYTYPGIVAFDPANHWPRIDATMAPVSHNRAPGGPPVRHYEQARVLGGGSSINGQVANRGIPADYDEWAAAGATGWDWRSVLATFVRLERDLDKDGPLHGKDGPLPISRIPRARWPGFSHALAAALEAAGHRDIEDQNGCFEDGFFPQTITNDGTRRVSAATAYLGADVRRRANLTILTGTEVDGLVPEGRRVAGVAIGSGAERRVVRAREVIVSAGAIHSPAMLLRAGIGPAGSLRALGIEPVLDLPGVGRNLQEHPGISVSAFLPAAARLAGTTRRHNHVSLRYSSGLDGCPASDMYMLPVAKSGWHALGDRIGTLVTWINRPFSRGAVEIAGVDRRTPPRVSFNHLQDPRDAARLMAAMRMMAALLANPALAGSARFPVASSYTGFAKKLGIVNARNRLVTGLVAGALDLAPPLRAPFFRRFVGGGLTLDELVRDDEALEAFVRERVFGQWHPSGTCRMGPAGDRDAVTDPGSARVHGLAGLRVVDASLMPVIPRANLNLPTIMIAEHLAPAIRAAL